MSRIPRANQAKPTSYIQLVFETIAAARRPLSIPEIMERVSRRRPIDTAAPTATIRGAIGQLFQVVAPGPGSYWFLPRLLEGATLRHRVIEAELSRSRFMFSSEVFVALWPSHFEIHSIRRDARPVLLALPNGEVVRLDLDFAPGYLWGCDFPAGLRGWFDSLDLRPGDDLILRAVDVGAGRFAVWRAGEAESDRDTIARRNREVADLACQTLGRTSDSSMLLEMLTRGLIAKGAFADPVPPAPLSAVLRGDPRFADAGHGVVALAEVYAPVPVSLALYRHQRGDVPEVPLRNVFGEWWRGW